MTAAKADLFAILNAVPDGYQHLRLAILQGRIDPMYPNVSVSCKRGCLKAHLAEFKKCDSGELPGAARFYWRGIYEGKPQDISPIEKHIASVRWLQTPTTCPILKEVLGWMDEWQLRRTEGGVEPEETVGVEEDFEPELSGG